MSFSFVVKYNKLIEKIKFLFTNRIVLPKKGAYILCNSLSLYLYGGKNIKIIPQFTKKGKMVLIKYAPDYDKYNRIGGK